MRDWRAKPGHLDETGPRIRGTHSCDGKQVVNSSDRQGLRTLLRSPEVRSVSVSCLR